ncbi:hypothetical protein EDC01DRAFT_642366 [Geopyxis carbonaria]|nr:hypothetical protein EDC01DRAFT_642366 [Geopyxis carbonaria]
MGGLVMICTGILFGLRDHVMFCFCFALLSRVDISCIHGVCWCVVGAVLLFVLFSTRRLKTHSMMYVKV